MKPLTCKSCGAMEFTEHLDAYVCAYCDTRYPKEPSELKKVTVQQSVQTVQPGPVPSKTGTSAPVSNGLARSKWVALVLCFYLGTFGAHKFYEHRIGLGLLYLFTFGLLGIGWLVDCIILLCKPNPYYV